jgi:hypothetical protein
MQPTATGPNRTGAAVSPQEVKLMLDAVEQFSPPIQINTLQIDAERQSYITEANNVGSIPPAQGMTPGMTPSKGGKSSRKAATATAGTTSVAMGVLMDKLGERLAFERTGTRLYDALITKYLALSNAGASAAAKPSNGGMARAKGEDVEASTATLLGEDALETLMGIRADELAHFQLLTECITALGGDPTSQTPCADVSGSASIGIMQVVSDPRTTLAQSLGAMLTAELTDNAGWELLSELAVAAGRPELADQFANALSAEAEHLEIVRDWIRTLLTTEAGSPAV